MTYTIKVNCRKTGIGLLTTLWIISSFFSMYSAYLNYLTSESYDAQNDCHFNFVLHGQFCKSICDKNPLAYMPEYSCPTSTKDYFINTEYAMVGFTILIQIGAFIILNTWKDWVNIECINHSEKQNSTEVTR